MFGKHFIKTLIIFTGMIAIGLIGIFLVSYFDVAKNDTADSPNIAKDAPCSSIKGAKPC